MLFCLPLAPSLNAADPPHRFVIFYVDDLGWADTPVRMMDDESLSVRKVFQIPALERFAKPGRGFTSGYVPMPTCTASRISNQFGRTQQGCSTETFSMYSPRSNNRGAGTMRSRWLPYSKLLAKAT